jgi:hypothetical protein
MPTVMQRMPATITLSLAFFVIYMWVLALSSSPVIASKGLAYYMTCGVVASFLTAYFLVIAAVYIARLARE